MPLSVSTKALNIAMVPERDEEIQESFGRIEKLLLSAESRAEARELCFQAIAKSPNDVKYRLLLAKSFYLDHMPEYCARELIEVSHRTSSGSVKKLLEAMVEYVPGHLKGDVRAESPRDTKTVAEVDLDLDFSQALDELKKTPK